MADPYVEGLREILSASSLLHSHDEAEALQLTELRAAFIPRTDHAALEALVDEMAGALKEARIWHEQEAKALSKQPPTLASQWRRAEHAEEIDRIDATLTKYRQFKERSDHG